MLNLSLLKNILITAAVLLPSYFANAQEYQSGALKIFHPWSQQLPPNTPAVAAYFVIQNTGNSADRLVSVDTTIANKAVLHQHVMRGALMRMQPMASVEIPPNGTITFAPMTYHVMLVDLKDHSLLRDGKHFPMTLNFEKAGAIVVDVNVHG